MGRKGGSGDGGMRSYQVPNKVQGKAGYAGDGRMKCARGCMGVHGADSASFIKPTYTALREAEAALHAHFSDHAWG